MSMPFGIFEDVDTGQHFVINETQGLLGRSAECNIRVDSAHGKLSRKQVKFYSAEEGQRWIVNIGQEQTQCLLSGERCEVGDYRQIKAGDILQVGLGSVLKQFKYAPIARAVHQMGDGDETTEDGTLSPLSGVMKADSKGLAQPAIHGAGTQTSRIPLQPVRGAATQLPVAQEQHAVPVAASDVPLNPAAPAPPPPAPPLPARVLLPSAHQEGPAPAPPPPPPPPPLPPQQKLLHGRAAGPAPPPPPPPPPKRTLADTSGQKPVAASGTEQQQATAIPLMQKLGGSSRQEFLQQLVARSSEVKERLRKQPLTCVSLAKPASAKQGSAVPTEDELRLARAALRQTMVPTTVVEHRPSARNGASIPANAPGRATCASSVWSDSPPQHKHWSCQNVMQPIPASTGTPDALFTDSQVSSMPEAAAKTPLGPANALSPARQVPMSGAQLADAWIRSPAGEEFMAAVVAAEAKAEDASLTVAGEPASSISLVPTQPATEAKHPGDGAARGATSFSFGPALVPGVSNSESQGGRDTSNSVQQDHAFGTPVRQSPLAVSIQPGTSPSPQLPTLHAEHSEQASRAASDTPGASELSLARSEVKQLQAVVAAVQQLLPQPDAPQALADVHAFVAEVRHQMQAKPASPPPVSVSAAPRAASAPGSLSLLKVLGGRGLGKGKGLILSGGLTSSARSSASAPASPDAQTATPSMASSRSIGHSQSKRVWEPQGPDFVCPVDDPEKMVGLSVWRYYENGGWAKGSVFDWQPYSRVHTIVYNPGSHSEFSEFVNLEQGQPCAMISWRDPMMKVARVARSTPGTNVASSHGEVSPVASVHASCTNSTPPRVSAPQFSFWPPGNVPAQEVPPSPAWSPLAGQALVSLRQQTPQTSHIPGPPTAATEWLDALHGSPQQCGDTLLNMLTTPEAQSLSPGICFALDSAIRSAQCTLADPNAEFTEPLSPPVWHTQERAVPGFGWLNKESHYVSSTQAAQAAGTPSAPAASAAAGEHDGAAAEDVDMSDAPDPAPSGVVVSPQGQLAATLTPTVSEAATKLAPEQQGHPVTPVLSPLSVPPASSAGQLPTTPLETSGARAPASPAPLQQRLSVAQPALSPMPQQHVSDAGQPSASPQPQPQKSSVAQPPPTSPFSQPELSAANPSPSLVPLQQQQQQQQHTFAALPPHSPVPQQQGLSAAQLPASPSPLPRHSAQAHRSPMPVQEERSASEPPSSPTLMPQGPGSTDAPGRSPSLALPSVCHSGRPASPLSVMGVPPASPERATPNGPASNLSRPGSSKVPLGLRLGVDMYESPESTMEAGDSQINQDAGVTPFLGRPPATPVNSVARKSLAAAVSPHPEITAGVSLDEGILLAQAEASTPRIAPASAISPLPHRAQHGDECRVGTPAADGRSAVTREALALSGGPAVVAMIDATAQGRISAEVAAAAHSPVLQVTETVAQDTAMEDSAPTGDAPAVHIGFCSPAIVQGSPAGVATPQGSTHAVSVSRASAVPSPPTVAEESADPAPAAFASPVPATAAMSLQGSLLPAGEPEEQLPACMPLGSPPVLHVEPTGAVSSPTTGPQGSSSAVTPQAAPASVTSVAAAPGDQGTPARDQSTAMLNVSVLALPPCSELAGARTPHPTPTGEALTNVTAPKAAAVSMSALHDVMLGAGTVVSGSPLAAASPVLGQPQATPRSARVSVHLTPRDTPADHAPVAMPASEICAAHAGPAADDAPSVVRASAAHDSPSGVTAKAAETHVAMPREQSSQPEAPLSVPVGGTPGTCAALALVETVVDGGMCEVNLADKLGNCAGQDSRDVALVQAAKDGSADPEADAAVDESTRGQSPSGDECDPCHQDGDNAGNTDTADILSGSGSDGKGRISLECGLGSQGAHAQPAEPASAEEQATSAHEQDENQAQGEAPIEDGPAESVPDTLIENESAPAASDPILQRDDAQLEKYDSAENKEADDVGAGEQLQSRSGGGAVNSVQGNAAVLSKRRVTRAQAQNVRASIAVSDGGTSQAPEPPTNTASQPDGPVTGPVEGAAVQGSEVTAPASSCGEEGGTSSRRTRSSRRTVAPSAAEADSVPRQTRRTRARASTSVASEAEDKTPELFAHVPRKPRSKRGQSNGDDSVVSETPAPSSEGPSLRRRTRATSAATVASTSADTGAATDCENEATNNLATSKLREAGEQEDDEPPPAKFVATLSPIPEDIVPKTAKGKSRPKRKRPVKESVIEAVEEASRRVTRRATRSQDTS